MQVLQGLVQLGLRSRVSADVLLDAAKALEGTRDVSEAAVNRAKALLSQLDKVAQEGVSFAGGLFVAFLCCHWLVKLPSLVTGPSSQRRYSSPVSASCVLQA